MSISREEKEKLVIDHYFNQGKTFRYIAEHLRLSFTSISQIVKKHQDEIGPVSTMAFITCVWMTVTTVAEILADRGVKLFIHPSHNVSGDNTVKLRLDEALAEYKKRIAGV